ncbi:uncharacterized protein E5676_scaffold216G00180 [Cucumis melo var. makuwa]|uniref:Uncharacterized protein n=1 Tax=Cucumis melo var. makuwa TaxID=1194695 RepID=A0A5A7UQH1_CUCMM|nr:uncharacterized protein E6C27_scaffold280G002220 [Cucumis melo var. makuwa]TYK30049.1 uncharacterized protein E5676_scaffold216G00180 [Cucumis melo var. makuwa]
MWGEVFLEVRHPIEVLSSKNNEELDKRAGSCGGVPPKWVVERRRHSVEWEPRVSGRLQCAPTDSLIKRSLFEIKCNRHSVLPPLVDGPYVGDRPQVHRVEEEWEQMADIAQVCLEEASRPMEERVDQKRCPLEFEWMTKLPINGATMSYDYLSTWNWRKTEKSRKFLLTE